MNEDIVVLEEQLASAEANIERLQARLAEAEATLSARDGELSDARRQLEAARTAASQHEQSASDRTAEVESLRAALASAEEGGLEAARRYRELVLAREPELPSELVQGSTVQEVDEALLRARETVAQVRQHLEQQAQALRVPAGAPVRGAADASTLTPSEKIRLGLNLGT